MNKYHFFLLFSVLLSSTSQILLKKGALNKKESFWSVYLNSFTIGGYLLLTGVTIINLFLFRHIDFITIVFFMPLSFIFIAVFSRLFFKEPITVRTVVGAASILGGITFLYV